MADLFPENQIRIVRLARGHVRVGRCFRDGEYLVIVGGAIVRRWGTAEGLGELAEKGPLANTKLDAYHRASRSHVLSVIEEIACNNDAWAPQFRAWGQP